MDHLPATLGQIQPVWDAGQAANGQSGLGVRRIRFSPNETMVIHIRPAMVTYVQLPTWEGIGRFLMGENVVFTGERLYRNSFYVAAATAGADTNVIVIGETGLVYSFVFIADEVKGARTPDLPVTVEADWPLALLGAPTSAPMYGSRAEWAWALEQAPKPPKMAMAPPVAMASVVSAAAGSGPAATDGKDDLGPLRREELVFGDYEVKIADPKDDEIRPIRVFHDRRYTYFDFGRERSALARRPVVHMLVDGVDSPVNTRTVGQDHSILVAEAIGDFTLQHGSRVVCIFYHGRGLDSKAAAEADPASSEEMFRRLSDRTLSGRGH